MDQQKGGVRSETLVQIALAVLVIGAAWLVIDPLAGQAGERDNIRRSQIVSLLSAVKKYGMKREGKLPPGIDRHPATVQVLGTETTGCDLTCESVPAERACLDLTGELVAKGYLKSIPHDPRTGSDANSDYYLNVHEDGRLTVGTCDAERSAHLHVTR